MPPLCSQGLAGVVAGVPVPSGGSPFAALATVVGWVDGLVALLDVALAVERSEVADVVGATLGVGDVVVGLECHGVEVVEGGVDCLSAPVAYGAGCSF